MISGVQRTNRVVVQSPARHDARAVVLDQHVGFGRQPAADAPALLAADVQGDALLVPVQAAEGGGVEPLAPAPERIALFPVLDLDDLGAEVRHEHGSERAGDVTGQFQNP